jgi:hypothetical protein
MTTTTLAGTPGVRARARLLWRPRRPDLPTALFAGSLALYLGLGIIFALWGHAVGGDAISRVEMADRVIFGRDPHLAAVGFVWSPIPVLGLLPFVVLAPLIPAMVTQALAAPLLSALFMAGAVYQMARLLGDLRLSRRLQVILTLCFALQPMILEYAANGMSEAALLFFLMLVVRRLHAWMATDRLSDLVGCGIYLGLAYLTRYESTAAFLAVVVVVTLTTVLRTAGGRRLRWGRALVDGVVVGLPFLIAFSVWALLSYMITGQPFQQFSSAYGNSSQIAQAGITTLGLGADLSHALQTIGWSLLLAPGLILATLLLALRVLRHHEWTALGAPLVLWAVLAFMIVTDSLGATQPHLRYDISAIPLTLVMVALFLSLGGVALPARPPHWWRRAPGFLGLLLLASCLLALPSGWRTVLDPAANDGDAYLIRAMLQPARTTVIERELQHEWDLDQAVSARMDALHLGPGRVLMDDFNGFVIYMDSSNQDQYVITSDRDFTQYLSDPGAFGVAYILIPDPTQGGGLDAINRTYPSLYRTGAGIATLVRTFTAGPYQGASWRLYRVTPNS